MCTDSFPLEPALFCRAGRENSIFVLIMLVCIIGKFLIGNYFVCADDDVADDSDLLIETTQITSNYCWKLVLNYDANVL